MNPTDAPTALKAIKRPERMKSSTVISSVFSLFSVSWLASKLWFQLRKRIFYASPCELLQLSTLLYYLYNLFLLTGRLLAVGVFVASVGFLHLLYVLLIQVCLTALTDVAVTWGHEKRSKRSKENVVHGFWKLSPSFSTFPSQ
ncbi:unnamed protein product [Dibothriocephalus latus]|uniref:XK-related protein n=1 Tax=Dibothriocephalus latus TaxID=60516 RepID=A0A3P7MD26_DIBLA|nr:unnamed protein product [Dibothriocephalus latus]